MEITSDQAVYDGDGSGVGSPTDVSIDHVHFRGPVYRPASFDQVENLERYKRGGFHPVHLGDTYGTDGRYRVVHKLGYGGFATVWLARDACEDRYVALKITTADRSKGECAELEILKTLSAGPAEHPGKQHIAQPLDDFKIEGPNGSHICVVMPVLGPQVAALRLYQKRDGDFRRKISLQASQALAFIHSNGVGHGGSTVSSLLLLVGALMLTEWTEKIDFTPSNILLTFADFDSWTEEEVYERFGHPDKDQVLKIDDGPLEPCAPSYVVQVPHVADVEGRFLTDQIMIVDFGESFFLQNPPKGLGTPFGYYAPDLLFDGPVSSHCDIWALACTICEIRTGESLFEMFLGDGHYIIQQIVEVLGRLPDPWWAQWEKRERFFDEDGKPLKRPDSGEMSAHLRTIQDLLRRRRTVFWLDENDEEREASPPPPVTEEEVDVLSDLLLKMLKYHPEERISVVELLRHPWFERDFS